MTSIFQKYEVLPLLKEKMTDSDDIKSLLDGIIYLTASKYYEKQNSPDLVQERLCCLLKTASYIPKFQRHIGFLMGGINQLAQCIDGRNMILHSEKLSADFGTFLLRNSRDNLPGEYYKDPEIEVKKERERNNIVALVKTIYLIFSRAYYENRLLQEEKLVRLWSDSRVPLDISTNETPEWSEMMRKYNK